jgi:hypothetical protein
LTFMVSMAFDNKFGEGELPSLCEYQHLLLWFGQVGDEYDLWGVGQGIEMPQFEFLE